MRAVDTNILVRLVARDDFVQVAVAKNIIEDGDVLILPTVLLECEWVLRSRYRIDRRRIALGLRAVCGLPGITVVSADAVAATLTRYAEAGDFADLLHLALAKEHDVAAFVTFDREITGFEADGPRVEIAQGPRPATAPSEAK